MSLVVRLCLVCLTLYVSVVSAQPPERWTSGEIFERIGELRVLGSVLYIAAHPDDENTRLISHLANDLKMHTTYLSITRGDGGQNLIGPEIGPLLGVIRTQELLQARRVDHGHQRFTRANDFGYSKTPDETLRIWNQEEVLADVIRAIRTEQPDIIINRFSAEPSPGNHGHHVASAILSEEAFDLAGDAGACQDQLGALEPWQPTRLFWNTSWWFYGSRENFESADKSHMVQVDIGGYDPVVGLSNTEIAARSRSMHKSQGFGSTGARGSELEFLDLIRGRMPADPGDPFAGINTTWSRIPGAEHLDALIQSIEKEYDFLRPDKSVKGLLNVRKEISALPYSLWKERKLADIDAVIVQAMGLFIEANASSAIVAAGDSVEIDLELINRSPVSANVLGVSIEPMGHQVDLSGTLEDNHRVITSTVIRVGAETNSTTPYWLERPGTIGMYNVPDPDLIGLPETPRAVWVQCRVFIEADTLEITRPVVYRETDPVKGEVYRPFEIVPPVFVNLGAPVYVFPDATTKSVDVVVRAARDHVQGVLRLEAGEGWIVSPEERSISVEKKGEEFVCTFKVTPTDQAQDIELTAEVNTEGRVCDQMLTEIQYDHIPAQTVLRKCSAKAVRIDLKRGGNRIAYLEGAGDEIPASLAEVGYHVEMLTVEDLTDGESLRRFDAVVLGIRAYNTIDRLRYLQAQLFEYVQNGGTLITQYNTTSSLRSIMLAPYPMEISRLRVTDESAPVKFLEPDHPALTSPNKLTQEDFAGWVQERGLYFPQTWDPALLPLLEMSDPGEDPLQGALLVAEYGKGYFVYTGLSFFRQLPDGVPGAYRLFANLLALGQNRRS